MSFRRTCYAARDPINQFGVIVKHESTIREGTVLAVERSPLGRYYVTSRTCGVLVHSESGGDAPFTEAQARDRFERLVEEHYANSKV